MSMFDSLVNSALNSVNGGQSNGTQIDQIMQAASTLLQRAGGINGLVNNFNQAGLGHIISSWVGTGANTAITGDQLSQVLGSAHLSQLAQQLGVDPTQASNLLSQYLPQIIDHLTPNGQVPADHQLQGDLLSNALGMLKGRLLG